MCRQRRVPIYYISFYCYSIQTSLNEVTVILFHIGFYNVILFITFKAIRVYLHVLIIIVQNETACLKKIMSREKVNSTSFLIAVCWTYNYYLIQNKSVWGRCISIILMA